MGRIRPETEIDRTQTALAERGAGLPLARGDVEIVVTSDAAASTVGQRLLVLLVNELARMKGVVACLHVVGLGDEPLLPQTPLVGATVREGLGHLVASLNGAASDYRAQIAFASATEPAVRLLVGGSGDGLVVAADGWRALLGSYACEADWAALPPYGAGLAAALAATEAFKRLLVVNGGPDPQRRLVTDMAYSAFNYGVGPDAGRGPNLRELLVSEVAVVGCGAGGSGALYMLAMQPGLRGQIALVEHGFHKLSNINRYLMATASDVHEQRHKLASVANHLARFAPGLRPTLHPIRWELLDEHPWRLLLSTVDTVEARWEIQRRAAPEAEILDGAVLDLLYGLLRVADGGRCLECKHPYDPELTEKQRAARWGQALETVRQWMRDDIVVTAEMIEQLALTQNQPPEVWAALKGIRFRETLPLTECGVTPLRTDVPSQAPVLPVATTPVGVLLAAEIAKYFAAPEAQLANSVSHDLGRAPERPCVKWRPPVATCPRHGASA